MITQERAILVFVIVLLAAVAFLEGKDRELDKQDQATRQDRIRLICQNRPYDLMCLGIYKEKN